MFCPKCGSEIAEGSAFCGKCGAPAGAQAGGAAVGGAPAAKKSGARIGAIAAVAVVAVVLVAGFATNWFGLAGVQPEEAVEVPAAGQGAGDAQGAGDGSEGDSQDAAGAAVKSAVEAYTWDELSQISAEIGAAGDEAAAVEVAKKYNLCTPDGKLDGTQVKSVTLADGTQTYVQIVGFAHDDKTGGGKAGITFIFGDCVAEAPMNPTDTSAGGWEASQMRAYLNGDWRAQLPEDLNAAIVPADKLTNNAGGTQDVSAVTATSDSLWLLSATELCGAIDWCSDSAYNAVLNAEGFEYKLFRDTAVDSMNMNEILVKNFQGSPCFWWGRSPFPNRSDIFNSVLAVGRPDGANTADYSNGVVPGFCI